MPEGEYECNYCGTVYRFDDAVTTCDECRVSWCSKCHHEDFCPDCSVVDDNEPVELPLAEDPEAPTLLRFCPKCDAQVFAWAETKTNEIVDPDKGRCLELTEEILCITCGYVHETKTTKEVL